MFSSFGAPLRHSGAQRLVSQGTGILPEGRTIGCIHQLPERSIGVQFELVNFSTDQPTTYNACYALSAGVNDWITPLGADGQPDDTLWVPVTCGNSTTLVVPPAESPVRFRRVVTDFLPFTAPPPQRRDGGAGLCLFYRQFCASGVHTIGNFDGTVPDWNGNRNGQHPGQFSQSFGGGWLGLANYCIPGNFSAPRGATSAFAGFAPHAIMPTITAPMLTVMSVGDSILSGVASRDCVDTGAAGIGLLLTKSWNRLERPAVHRNAALSGQSNSDFIGDAELALDATVPDFMLLQTYSANEPNAIDDSVVWAQFQRSMSFASRGARAGVRIVLVTAPPYAGPGSYRPAERWEPSRKHANRLTCEAGLPVLDLDAILGTGSAPVTYRPGLSDDFVHPNHAGARVAAAAAVAIFSECYGIT